MMTLLTRLSPLSLAAGGLLALALVAFGLSPLFVAMVFVGFAVGVFVATVRSVVSDAIGEKLPAWKVAGFMVLGILLDVWNRFSCFMNGHDRPFVTSVGPTPYAILRPALIVRCGRCGRYMRPATHDEAKAYMTKRVAALNIQMAAVFEPLNKAMSEAARSFESLSRAANAAHEHRKRGGDAPTIFH